MPAAPNPPSPPPSPSPSPSPAGDRNAIRGLPSFEGKTDLETGAGAIEALILATEAIDRAADRIAGDARAIQSSLNARFDGPFLILAGEEAFDVDAATSLRAEIRLFEALFKTFPAPQTRVAAVAAGITASIAAIDAAAGLFRTEAKVGAVDLAAEISDRVLATAVAGRLGWRAILPGAAAAPPAGATELTAAIERLIGQRDRLTVAVARQPADQGEPVKAALARFDAFLARIMTADQGGQIPLARALRADRLLEGNPLVLRIFVEKAGGTLVNKRNILTFFGADPVEVSAGLVASYTITDPSTGRVLKAAVLSFRTRVGTLREIQSDAPAPAASIPVDWRDRRHAIASDATIRLLAARGRSVMPYKITVKPDDGRRAGWELHYFEYDDPNVATPNIHIPVEAEDDGVYSATIDLGVHRYCLACDVVGRGRKIEINVEPAPRIVQAPGEQWPITAGVPDHMQRDIVPIYFHTGEGQ